MRVTSSSLLAICVATSNALPALSPERRSLGVDAPRKLPEIDPSIPGCANTAFIDIWPPSKAELRCRGFKFDENNKIKPHVATEKRQSFLVGDRLPPIDESIPGCKDTAFIDIYPPSKAEMRCRGVSIGDDKKTPPVQDKRDPSIKDKRKQPWQVGDQLPPVDETIPGCKDVAFIDIYPPSEAELRCRGISVNGEQQKSEKETEKEDPKKITSREASRGGLSI
ncbi:hypothetical protein Slin14017_G122480 [Septoria linicola]|nr:hypothetical protein Slin14017_G122480 [Septoria linicola]